MIHKHSANLAHLACTALITLSRHTPYQTTWYVHTINHVAIQMLRLKSTKIQQVMVLYIHRQEEHDALTPTPRNTVQKKGL